MSTQQIPSPSSDGSPVPDSKLGIKKILVPTDFSQPSEKAFIYAERFAEQFKAQLIVLNVSEAIPPAPRYIPPAEIEEHQEEIHRATCQQMQEMHNRLTQASPDSGIPAAQFIAVDGASTDEILRLAKELDVDIIIIATHGRTGMKRWVLGSTTERVVRYAPCPVLVVREDEHEFVEVR